MKSYKRILLFLLAVLLLTILLSPWVAGLVDFITGTNLEAGERGYSFSRIFNRLYMVLGIAIFFAFRRRLKVDSPRRLGLGPFGHEYPDLLMGFFLALGSVVALALAMSLADVFEPYFRLSFSLSLERSIKALLDAIAVGFLEEIFFRGIVFRGLREDGGLFGAFLAANLFYSAIHFVRPFEKEPFSGLDPWAGVRHLIYSLQSFLDPSAILPGLFGLFLIGIVLSHAFSRAGSLYLAIGLHAGWVFGLKTIRVFGDFRREDLGWLFGSSDPKLVSGPAAWIGVLAVGVVVHLITRGRRGLSPPPR